MESRWRHYRSIGTHRRLPDPFSPCLRRGHHYHKRLSEAVHLPSRSCVSILPVWERRDRASPPGLLHNFFHRAYSAFFGKSIEGSCICSVRVKGVCMNKRLEVKAGDASPGGVLNNQENIKGIFCN